MHHGLGCGTPGCRRKTRMRRRPALPDDQVVAAPCHAGDRGDRAVVEASNARRPGGAQDLGVNRREIGSAIPCRT